MRFGKPRLLATLAAGIGLMGGNPMHHAEAPGERIVRGRRKSKSRPGGYPRNRAVCFAGMRRVRVRDDRREGLYAAWERRNER